MVVLKLFVFVTVLLLCLGNVVEIESKPLQEEQSLTEIADGQEDVGINLTTKKDMVKKLSLTGRQNPVPALSKNVQTIVELVDDSAPPETKNTIGIRGGLGILSREEASLVDQNVDNILRYYGFEQNMELDGKSASRVNVKPVTQNKSQQQSRKKDRTSNQQARNSLKQHVRTLLAKPSLDTILMKQELQSNQTKSKGMESKSDNQKSLVGMKQQQSSALQQSKKMSDGEFGGGKLVDRKMYPKIIIKDQNRQTNLRFKTESLPDSSQQKIVIHTVPSPKGNIIVKPSSLKRKGFGDNNSVENVYDSIWLPIKENDKLFHDEEREQASQNSPDPNAAQAAVKSKWMPIKENVSLIQNEVMQPINQTSLGAQGNNSSNESRDGVDIGVPYWLPMKEQIHRIQNNVSLEDKNMTTTSSNTMENNSLETPNSTEVAAKPSEHHDNASTSSVNDITGRNATTELHYDENEGSVQDGRLKIGNVTSTRKMMEEVGGFENLEDERLLKNFTHNNTMLPQNSKTNVNEIKKEKDVTKQIWSTGKVINSHGRESLHMTLWSPWSTCSETCGTNGLQIRTRKCTQVQEDQPCKDNTIDWKWCIGVDVCPDPNLHIVNHASNATYAAVTIEGNTSPNKWGAWSACSKRCGSQSLRVRNRKCFGQRSNVNRICVTPTMQWTWCNPVACTAVPPRHATKKTGHQKQVKPVFKVNNPTNKVEITPNLVIHTDDGIVFNDNCIVSPWSKWSKCSKTCGENSHKFRTRSCKCTYKTVCKSRTLERNHCTLDTCSGEDNYGPWSAFSKCTKPCGGGWKKRTRHCRKRSNPKGPLLCDQDLLIGVKVCNNHKCQKVSDGVMVANVDPGPKCGFNPCNEFGCMDSPGSRCLTDADCNPVFFNQYGHIDDQCGGWQRYVVKNPALFCGFDPCLQSRCQSFFGRCSVDLNCKAVILGAKRSMIDCNKIQYPF